MNKEDQTYFDNLLATWENLVFINDISLDGEVAIISDSLLLNESEDLNFYLARREDLNDIQLKFLPSQYYWYVDSLQSPVIKYSRCYFTDTMIRRGRLWFQPGAYKDSEWIDKNQDFVEWADTIIKKIRRKLKRYKHQKGEYTYSEYVGESTLKWAQENNAEILSGGNELAIEKE